MESILQKDDEKPDGLTKIIDDPESRKYELKLRDGFIKPFARGIISPAAMILYSVFAMSETLFLAGAEHAKQYNFPVEAKQFLISSAVAGVTTLVAFTYFYGKYLLEGERQGKVMPFQRSPVEIIVTYLLNSTRVRDQD
ncbi:MAG: hypothetical protein Q7J54_06840 [Candidatus Woesearchaeota archaeon]|nr:hypothetical protein [Candidatus Woesearchaeota archaeon]